MKKVKVVEIIPNNDKRRLVRFYETEDGKRYENLEKLLRALYECQGEFYHDAYGYSSEDTSYAKWHPQDSDFDHNCEGWRRFVKDKGKIQLEIKKRVMTVKDIVEEELFSEKK
jgi:hypothetical protein